MTKAESLPTLEARVAGNETVSGARGGVDCSPLLLEEAGAHLHGRLTEFRDGRAWFGNDLDENLQRGITFERELCDRLDAYAADRLDLRCDRGAPRAPDYGRFSIVWSTVPAVLSIP